jgi:hypothetical protein
VKYLHRRRVSNGKWWSVYEATPDTCEWLHERDPDKSVYARCVFEERRIVLNAALGRSHYQASLAHEWQHVEQHAHGLHDGEWPGRMHRAIEAAAVLIAKIPKEFPE